MLTAKPTVTFDTASERNPHFTPQMRDAKRVALVAEHDDLDCAIAALLAVGSCDDLLITRLKKRKLQLKDEIALVMPPADYITSRATA